MIDTCKIITRLSCQTGFSPSLLLYYGHFELIPCSASKPLNYWVWESEGFYVSLYWSYKNTMGPHFLVCCNTMRSYVSRQWEFSISFIFPLPKITCKMLFSHNLLHYDFCGCSQTNPLISVCPLVIAYWMVFTLFAQAISHWKTRKFSQLLRN